MEKAMQTRPGVEKVLRALEDAKELAYVARAQYTCAEGGGYYTLGDKDEASIEKILSWKEEDLPLLAVAFKNLAHGAGTFYRPGSPHGMSQIEAWSIVGIPVYVLEDLFESGAHLPLLDGRSSYTHNYSVSVIYWANRITPLRLAGAL